MRPTFYLLALSGACAATPASADVTQAGSTGFATVNSAVVSASPEDVWIELTGPEAWWNSEHSWSGDAANMSLFPVAGGCFCEELPESGGSVEHARVIYADPSHLLRMRGSLGPLQAEALTGTLSVSLEPVDGGTRITWEYLVAGYARFDLVEIAPVVDSVQREQMTRLAARLGSVE